MNNYQTAGCLQQINYRTLLFYIKLMTSEHKLMSKYEIDYYPHIKDFFSKT